MIAVSALLFEKAESKQCIDKLRWCVSVQMTTVADIVSGFADPDANIIFGTVIDDTFKVRSCLFQSATL
jgi:hypothetical protein